jgi:hypothetical protein
MKFILIALTVSSMIACSDEDPGNHDEHQHDSASTKVIKDTSKKSLPAEVSQTIGEADIRIKYHSPAVRGRTIWGGLVPYDEVWVTGAHSATTLEINKDFQIGNKTIPAGKYALFTIPSRDEWTIIINKNWEQHLADDYSQTDDVVRLKAKPGITGTVTERLKYEIEPTADKAANIIISWEQLRVPFQIQLR